ncbi:MAG: ABC transporter ATP-binding protein/permease [Candidatus Methanoplasma sp.]|jgi:ATP-binding cassette subfamily B protein|nr:ABC transporter ATP-binding protein/permease [Candidatus Methanoplasma sp.]
MSEDTQSRRPARGPFGGGNGPGMGPVEKPKEFKKTWISLIRYSRSHMPIVIAALVMAALGAVLEVIGPDKLKDLTNEIIKGVWGLNGGLTGGIDIGVVTTLGFILIGLYVGAAVLKIALNWIMATVTQKISRQMRSDISRKINRLPFSYFNKASYGDVLSRITNDVDAIGTTLNQSIPAIVTAVTMLIGSLIMMLITNWTMALTAVGSSILGFVLMAIIVTKSQKFFVAQQKDLGNINGHIEEAYTGHTIIKAYNSSREFKKTFEEINRRLYVSGWKSQFFSGMMWPLMSFIGNFGYVAVCVVGAVLTMNGTISYGVIVAFMLYVRLFTQPLSQLAQAASSLQRTAAASERVFEFLDEKEMEDESQKVKRITDAKGDVEFRNVKFGYSPDKTVIRDFSAKVKAGENIAIVGPTGAGKTTLVNLLMRFYEIDSGEILLDGIPINEVQREDVHEQFCMVLQDTWLFEGTIKENIVYSMQNISDEEVVSACKTVGLHHFIHTLPDGYDTVLNDNTALSEGQKQLLTIARAIIKGSPLLILDEATSSVDTRTERIVQEAMNALTVGRTAFIIAHRLSTIKNADKILVIRDGDIIESGTHSELLAKNGFYAELYNSQFETAA